MSLIEQLGGYEKAKLEWEREGAYPSPNYFYYRELGYELLQYRREHNIYEMDDYVIHDDELMVFAMWSEAVKDCAYVGYAYAEDGFLLHKDEFRHATNDEIKAGENEQIPTKRSRTCHSLHSVGKWCCYLLSCRVGNFRL